MPSARTTSITSRKMSYYTVIFSLSLCTRLRFCHSFTSSSHTNYCHQNPVVLLLATITNRASRSDEIWEWDGTVQEGAHDDEFESIDDTDDEEFVPSIGFMSAAALLADTTTGTGVASTDLQASTILFDPLKNYGIIHRLSAMEEEDDDNMSEDDLLEMGGDPDFLGDDDDESAHGTNQMSILNDMDASVVFEWDGMVDEDAHLDL